MKVASLPNEVSSITYWGARLCNRALFLLTCVITVWFRMFFFSYFTVTNRGQSCISTLCRVLRFILLKAVTVGVYNTSFFFHDGWSGSRPGWIGISWLQFFLLSVNHATFCILFLVQTICLNTWENWNGWCHRYSTFCSSAANSRPSFQFNHALKSQ